MPPQSKFGQHFPAVFLFPFNGKVGEQGAHLVISESGNGQPIQASIETAQQHELEATIISRQGH